MRKLQVILLFIWQVNKTSSRIVLSIKGKEIDRIRFNLQILVLVVKNKKLVSLCAKSLIVTFWSGLFTNRSRMMARETEIKRKEIGGNK